MVYKLHKCFVFSSIFRVLFHVVCVKINEVKKRGIKQSHKEESTVVVTKCLSQFLVSFSKSESEYLKFLFVKFAGCW